MIRIGLLSDTHGYLPPGLQDFFGSVDEIWHAGDIGTSDVAVELSKFRPLIAVHGNIDGAYLRQEYPEFQFFERDGLKCLMIHIGGYPGHYSPRAGSLIRQYKPGLFISGHSHILRVMPDAREGLLHINPGAAGYQGMHQVITLVRFRIEEGRPRDLEVYETPRRKV